VEITDRSGMRRAESAVIDPALRVYYSLFGLVIAIALFGIANTLVLSILERVRELGLLRAVGMDRRQIRSLIRWEAIIIAGIGAVTGLALGAFLGWATTIALDLPVAAVPVAQLALFTAFAIMAGALAAALPARRAARTNILHAVTAE
jgi:putative ABC transport system permease protein